MPISGPVVHQQLMAGYTNAQAALKSARESISDTKEQRDQLDDTRGEALVDLAEHYLPELTRDAIRTTWVEIRSTVAQIIERKESHCSQLRQSLDRLNLNRDQEESRLVSITERRDAALDVQHSIAEEVESALRQDQEFAQLSDRAAVAEAALERAEANLNEIEQDAASKLPAYDNSKLFRYLYDQGFGTPKYPKRGFTRRMDRSIAKLIDFNKAKQGYEFLKTTPEQMRKIIATDRQSFDTVMLELERRRDQVALEKGLLEKIQLVEQLQAENNAQVQQLDELRQKTETTEHELTDLENTRGPYYREAITVFRDMLDRADTRDLARRARSTAEITDDQIVAQLSGVQSDIENLDTAAKQRRDEIRLRQEFLDALGRMIQQFRASEFDSSRSQFVGSLDIVEELHRGRDARDVDYLWDKIRESQRWGPTAVEQLTKVATHPLTQILINAMAHAAGGALENHARRAGHRRSGGRSWSGGFGSGWDSSSGDHRRRR
ncbi:MAG: hypothetical protein WBD20_06000 [Pirellulaceae bacterium]